MNFMPYSPATMQSAFSANESRTTLHRHMITVSDAEESHYGATKEAQEYETFKNNYEKKVEQMVMDTLRQGDNYEDSNI